MFGWITLFTALGLAAVAAGFAVFGIVSIFAGAPIAAAIMGTFIELGKLTAVSWVYRNWKEPTQLKYIILPLIFIAMLLTSMGIFGFLSKAHIEQNADVGDNTLKIERLDQRIEREQNKIGREEAKIKDAEIVVSQLDETIQTLIEFDKISDPVNGARAVREKQQPQRDALSDIIRESQNRIDQSQNQIGTYQDERLELSQEIRQLELEIGPVKYIAELIYEEPENSFEDTVRIVIIAFIFVFDPMAIVLLMAANYTLMRRQNLFDDNDDIPSKNSVPNTNKNFVPSEPEPPKNEMIKDGELPKKHSASRAGKFVSNDRTGLKHKPIR